MVRLSTMHFDGFKNPYVRLTRVIGVNYTLFGACSNARAIVYFNSSFVFHSKEVCLKAALQVRNCILVQNVILPDRFDHVV